MSTLVPGRVASWRQTYWDWRAAGNFAGGGSGTGVLLYAAVVSSTALSLGLLGAALIRTNAKDHAIQGRSSG